MNHYETLEVSPSASLKEIKSSFRRKVKLVHPDLNPNKDSNEAFLRLNEAYEVLSDSTTRNLYDMYLQGVPLVTEIEQVTPREKYKANYVRERIRKQRERIAYEIKLKQRFYSFLRVINVMAFLMALITSYDYYNVSNTYESIPDEVSIRTGDAVIYFDRLVIKVHESFYSAYYKTESRKIILEFSGILKIPIRVRLDEINEVFFVNGNLYVFRNGFSVIMFLFSIIVVGNKKYTDFRLTCGLVASFVLLWVSLLLTGYR